MCKCDRVTLYDNKKIRFCTKNFSDNLWMFNSVDKLTYNADLAPRLMTTCSCLWRMNLWVKSSPQGKLVKIDCASFLLIGTKIFKRVTLWNYLLPLRSMFELNLIIPVMVKKPFMTFITFIKPSTFLFTRFYGWFYWWSLWNGKGR